MGPVNCQEVTRPRNRTVVTWEAKTVDLGCITMLGQLGERPN